MKKPELILASASPRRKELFERLGLSFTVEPSGIEEQNSREIGPSATVLKLAEEKARAVAYGKSDTLIVGADTLVEHRGKILGQPANSDEAVEMLSMLSASTHRVITGICLILTGSSGEIDKVERFAEETKVEIAPLAKEEIDLYVRSGEPLDKAGSYGIQDSWGLKFVSRIEGDYNNVVGFPVHRFYQTLKSVFPETATALFGEEFDS